jgi:hypothetical protein
MKIQLAQDDPPGEALHFLRMCRIFTGRGSTDRGHRIIAFDLMIGETLSDRGGVTS